MTATFLPAGIITEHPEMAVRSTRGRGYQWPPFDQYPTDFFRGASSIGKVIDKPGLMHWRSNLTAEAAADRRDKLTVLNKREAIKLIKGAAKDAADLAPARGSTVHDYAANQLAAVAGLPYRTVDVGTDLDTYAANVTGWIDQHVLEVCAIERTLYVPHLKIAGTVDAIVRTSAGVFGVDWKTKYGKGVHQVSPYLEHAMQAWALAAATHIAIPEQQQLHDLPPLDGFLVVYIASDGHVTYPVDVTSQALGDLCTHAVAILDRIDACGTAVFGPVTRHLTHSTSAPAQVAPPVTA